MIFNSQGAAELKQFINGGSITPGEEVTLPKGAELLGDLTIEAVPPGGEGEHAWRKYSGTPTKTFACRAAGVNDLEIINAFGFNREEIDVSFLAGFSGGRITAGGTVYDVSFPSNGVLQIFTNGSSAGTCPITYNPATGKINMGSWVVNTWFWSSGFKKTGSGSLVGYVVDDNSAAYPEAGTQDGNYYLKI